MQNGKRLLRTARRYLHLSLFTAIVGGAAIPSHAQTVQTGNIHGRITDQSGGALPGVAVALSSPSLLAPQERISDGTGDYRFDQLPVGTYRLTYTLAGFQTLVREDVQISAGFSAELNAQMQVGALEESIVVSGGSPVIDTTSPATSISVPAAVLADKLPVTRVMQSVLAVAPGVQSGVPDLGGGNVGTTTFTAYGMSGQSTPLIEGINTRRSANNVETNYDFTTIEDFQIVTFGGDADKALPGVGLNAVIKSGGNKFSGRHELTIEDDALEGNNLTDEIRAQGTQNPNLILTALDETSNVGGPVVQDRWWFFGAYHLNRSRRTALGYLLPNGEPGDSFVRAQNFTAKTTVQASKNYKLIGFWTRYTQYFPERFGSAFVPLENTRKFVEPATQYKIELQGTPSTRLFFNVFAGHHGYTADYYAKPDDGRPNTFDQATRMNTGPHLGQDRRPRMSEQVTGAMSFVPAESHWGMHELKVGSTFMFQWTGTRVPDGNHGNYTLVFNNGVPVQIQVFNYPVTDNRNSLTEGGVYAQDTWRIGRRVTVSLGLRYDSFVSWVPQQSKAAGTFGPPWDLSSTPAKGTTLDIPRVDVGAWRNLAPRLGVVWDLTGDGRNVLKSSYGRYNMTPGDDFAAAFNPNTATITTYRWTGPCPAGPAACDYVPGSVNLDPNGPDFLSITGGSNGGAVKLPNTELNPDLAQQFTRQFQLMFERELAPNLAMRGGLSYAQSVNLWQQNPIQIPYAAWNIPRVVYDAGPSKTPSLTNTVGTPLTIYDLDPAYRGSAFSRTQFVNRSGDYNDHFTSYELTLTKRAVGRWSTIASLSTTKNYRWLNALPTNPNQELFPLDTTRLWQFRLSGSYDLPWKFDLSAQYLVQNGLQGQRTNTYNLPNSGALVVPVEEFGATMGAARPNLNIRVARSFSFGRSSLRASAEVLNATNNSSPYAMTFTSGPAFGRITTISTPRIARFGVTYSF